MDGGIAVSLCCCWRGPEFAESPTTLTLWSPPSPASPVSSPSSPFFSSRLPSFLVIFSLRFSYYTLRDSLGILLCPNSFVGHTLLPRPSVFFVGICIRGFVCTAPTLFPRSPTAASAFPLPRCTP